MSSSSSHATVTYTYVSIDSDLPPWSFHLMEAYEPEAAPQSPEQSPLSHVPAPEYPEYLASSDDDIPAEDQPLHANASPTACSPGYIADSEPIEDDSEEDPEMDPVDYPFDKEEEEPSAPTDPTSPVPDPIPSSEETKPFETDESTTTPPSPYTVVPLSQTSIILEADMPPRKRACFTTPSRRIEIGESLAVVAAREPGSTLAQGIDYGLMTALEEVKKSVVDMDTRHRQDNRGAMYARQAWSYVMDCNRALHVGVGVLRAETRVL
ncbi:hypothetical protein Tco_1319967 [Tanacetum coccineum]